MTRTQTNNFRFLMGEDFYELVGLGKGGAQDGGLERWKWYNESLSFIDGSCFLDESGFHFLTMSGFLSVFICCLLKPSFLAVPSVFNLYLPSLFFHYKNGAHVIILLISKNQYKPARRQKTCLGRHMKCLVFRHAMSSIPQHRLYKRASVN